MPEKKLVLPPGVKLADEKPKTVLPCAKCRQPLAVDDDVLKEMRAEARGRPIALEHEVCPTDEAREPAATYFIEISIRRGERPEQPIDDDEVLAWFVAEHAADSLIEAFPSLIDKLGPQWEKLQQALPLLEITEETDPKPFTDKCRACGAGVTWQDAPTGGWWAHDVHPDDDHDAVPVGDENGCYTLPDGSCVGFACSLHT